MVGDGGPIPPEAFPGSPVPPGDRSWDAVDRSQPHRLLSQQGLSGSLCSFFVMRSGPFS